MNPLRTPAPTMRPSRAARGFTLVELMITLVVLAIVMVALGMILNGANHNKEKTSQNLEASQTARATLDMISKDVRCAGYGADLDYATPQPAIAYVDSTQIILSENLLPYPDGGTGPNQPLAFNPSGSPVPGPLSGTQWAPPIRYRTGAELVRYTLDLNDDGSVNASDLATSAGGDARATPNPNDYVLVRQVFGDSTGGVAGNEGGVQERVALVLKPGGSVPPLFTVYMRGTSTPWNWADGAVPASQLGNIDRVVVQVTASSSKPDARGSYPVTTMRTEINSMRNVPNTGITTYPVTGYVYDDRNTNHVMDAGDAGIPGVAVRLGSAYLAYTNGSGFFQFRAPVGSYTLKHTPAMGFGNFTTPDSFIVTISNAGVTRSFADTARSGGNVTITTYNDANGNGLMDAGESVLPGVTVTLGASSTVTNMSGQAVLFASPGGWSANVTVPDSMSATTPNPVTGTITNGGTASGSVGMQAAANGTLRGTVYKDTNKNGAQDGGEGGIQNVWVGVTSDNGLNVVAYAYTDASGNFNISVPKNDPPHTTPYSVYVVPPGNYFPTTSTAIAGIYVQGNQTLSGYAFGMANYLTISLTANRVLSLNARDLIEKDWNGNQTGRAHGDVDLVLGADAGGTDNISVWFNQYNATQPFATNASPDRAWLAPQSVLAIALDTLDANVDPFARPDLVTGTKYSVSGNFFVWYTQNSSGNEGYFPASYNYAYRTQDNGDVQAICTFNVLGGDKPDIIVGTKSATANQGSIEVWTNSNTATPTFTRAETYTTWGSGSMLIGEVTSMLAVDLDNDGLRDLVVGTRTSNYSGQVIYFKNLGPSAVGNHFQYMTGVITSSLAVTALAATDMDGDGYQDIIFGTQNGTTTGSLVQLKNNGLWGFSSIKIVNAPGIVLSLATADMGGGQSVNDLVVGWRGSTSNYSGGVSIYYLDVHGLPSSGTDPSGGTIINMVPAIAPANFNFGTYPSGAPSPYLTDVAVGVKSSITGGSLVIFVR